MLRYRVAAGIAALAIISGGALPALAAQPAPSSEKDAAVASSSAADAGASASVSEAGKYAPVSTDITVDGQSIGLDGVLNARQLGGYTGADGKAIKSGLLLRTGALSGATQADMDKLTGEYHLAAVVDLRSDAERETAPDPTMDGVEEVAAPAIDNPQATAATSNSAAASSLDMKATAKAGSDQNAALASLNSMLSAFAQFPTADDYMQNGFLPTYVQIVDSDKGKQAYHELFQTLIDAPEGQAVLWHCTAGQDRAGIASALVLSALGADRQTILDDYVLTNEFDNYAKSVAQNAEEAGASKEDVETFASYMKLPRFVMEGLLDHLDETYGSVHDYIVNELGVSEDDIKALQAKYLED